MAIVKPKDVGLPHQFWRPNQYHSYQRVLNIHNSGGGVTFQELATGSGKTAVATALGSHDRVTALVQTHSLLDQYERAYGFNIVKGKQEYPCVLETKVDTWKRSYNSIPTAADCHFKDMNNCPDSDSCPYLVARNIALQSDRMACTYKYAALSESVRARRGFLVMDEAHISVEEILSLSSFTLDDLSREHFGFPDFPLIDYGTNGEGDILCEKDKTAVLAWTATALSIVGSIDLFDMMSPNGAKNARMLDSLNSLFTLLVSGEGLFYKCSSKSSMDNDWRSYHRKNLLTMSVRTMTAHSMTHQLFSNKQTVLLMSATIGNPLALAGELGIRDYTYNTYPHPIPPVYRPVYRLDVPKMTKANIDANPALYKLQAQKIAAFINSMDRSWRGIVLTTSHYKINLLRRFLDEMLHGRVFNPNSEGGVAQRVTAFIENKDPGRIAVETIQGWGTGLDLRGDIARFAVVAGVPYSNPSDRFEHLRMSNPSGRRYALWAAHSATQQACGRVSRGEKGQDGDYLTNYAALADGSSLTNQAYSNYSQWFVEAIHEFTGTVQHPETGV